MAVMKLSINFFCHYCFQELIQIILNVLDIRLHGLRDSMPILTSQTRIIFVKHCTVLSLG